MEKSEIPVLIVDDDPTFLAAITEAVKREGYKPVATRSASEALNQYKILGANFIIVDCLLPKTPGVDLVTQLRRDGAADTPVVLMSGVFKDLLFSKDAIKKSGAIAFLNKPFNIPDFTKLLHQHLDKFSDEEILPLESLLISSPAPGEKIKIYNKLESIHGFDIPWLCAQLMSPAYNGVLKLVTAGQSANISFFEGKITQVEMQNPESYFGNLLIEHGFLTPEQLDLALKAESKKRIGERLVDLNFLSPHAIDIITAEQMANRLSKIIGDSIYSVNYAESKTTPSPTYLDTESIAPFVIDWLRSKITLDWLKQRYLKWLDCNPIKNTTALKWSRIWSFPLLKNNSELIKSFESGTSLGHAIASGITAEDEAYRVFHLLNVIEHIKLNREAKKSTDLNAQLKRLKRIWDDMKSQDHFSILGVTKSTRSSDVKKSYHELAKVFHPDKLADSAPADLKDLAKQVFGRMTEAYLTLSDESKKASYVKEMEMGRAEKILQAEALFEEGKVLLTANQAVRALEKLREAEILKPPTSDLLIHLAWALLASAEQTRDRGYYKKAEDILGRIPPEDRHNAVYYFVKGFHLRLQGDSESARKNIAHALALKPKFLDAERLMRYLDLDLKSKKSSVDLLHGDLKDVVGALFKKN